MASVMKSQIQSSFDSSILTHGASRVMPDRVHRTENYRRVLLNRKGKVDCKVLYRTIMRLEKPLRRSKTKRHKFIRHLFTAACNPEIDYNTIVDWLKDNYKVCVTVAEVRQLVLYCGIFGNTDNVLPRNENVRSVLKHCVMSVPRLHMYKRWCKDVKRLEKFPEEKDRARGYFATGNRDDETCTIKSLLQDFQTYDDFDEDEKEDAFDEGDDDHSVDSEEEISMKEKFRKGVKSVMNLNKIGFLSAGFRKRAKPAYIPRRKIGNANVYTNPKSTPEFNKFIANLDRGDSPNVKGILAKEHDELDIKFKQRARCTDSLVVKESYRKMKSGPIVVETVPEVDVDIMIDIMKESMQQQGISPKSKKQIAIQPPQARQSMAILMFNQSSKSKKKKVKPIAGTEGISTATSDDSYGGIDFGLTPF